MRLPRLATMQPRERVLAILGAAAVVVVLLDRAVLNPWMRHARRVREEIQQMERTLQTHQQLLARKTQVLAEVRQYHPYLKPAVADDLQMAVLLKEIEQLAGQHHVTISEIKPLTVEANELTKQYALEVRFTCTLEEWVNFVYQIEMSPALYQIARAGLLVQEKAPDRLDGYLRVVSTSLRGDAATSMEGASTHATAVD